MSSKEEIEPRTPEFRQFLLGDDEVEPRTYGLLHDVWDDRTITLSERLLTSFTHYLGIEYGKRVKGSFNDKHEDQTNQEDRTNRFIPEYDSMWAQSPSSILVGGLPDLIPVDQMDDVKLRVHCVDVNGTNIDLGGIPPAEGDIMLPASHNECVCKAGEYGQYGWKEAGKQQCLEKSEGPAHHISAFVVEWGNGAICRNPNAPAPYPITVKELRQWHEN